MSRYGDLAFTLCLAAAMAWLMAQTAALGSAAGFVPQITIALTLAILAAEFLRQLGRVVSGIAHPPRPRLGTREWRAIGWIGLTCLLVVLFGAACGSALVLAAYLRLEARTPWPTSLLCGAGLALGVDQGMRRTLGVSFPSPLLGW